MAADPTEDRGSEIVGTRITVYNLLPSFLDPDKTEAEICKSYGLEPSQVAYARAYVLNNAETVLARHVEIEAKLAAGNSAQVIESGRKTRASLLQFKEWLSQRDNEDSARRSANLPEANGRSKSGSLPSFKEWLSERESRSKAES